MFDEEPDTGVTEVRPHPLLEEERDTDVEVPIEWAMRSELGFELTAKPSELFLEVCRLTGMRVLVEGNRVLFFGDTREVKVARRFLEGASELTNIGLSIDEDRVASCLDVFRRDERACLLDGLDWLVPIEAPSVPETELEASSERLVWPPEETLH